MFSRTYKGDFLGECFNKRKLIDEKIINHDLECIQVGEIN